MVAAPRIVLWIVVLILVGPLFFSLGSGPWADILAAGRDGDDGSCDGYGDDAAPELGTASDAYLNPGFKLPASSGDPTLRWQSQNQAAVPGPVPESYLRDGRSIPYLYTIRQAERRHGVPWYVLAAISWQESKHGTDPGTWTPTAGDQSVGPMQFTPPTWDTFGKPPAVSNDPEAKVSIDSVSDQLFVAAWMLRLSADDPGTPRKESFTEKPERAIAALKRYNPHPEWLNDILFWAGKYAASGPGSGGQGPVADVSCLDVDAGNLQKVVDFVRLQVGRRLPGGRPVPYVWGAEGPDAFDCSGLMVAAYKTIGVNLPRMTAMQADSGQIEIVAKAPISGPAGLRPGDLLFIDNGGERVEDNSRRLGRNIAHVAMYLGGGDVGEASNPEVGLRISKFEGQWNSVAAVGRVIGLNADGGSGASGPWARPVVDAYVSSEYGPRGGEMHKGLDLAAGCGTPIYAVAAGTVILASSDVAVVGGYGKYIVIDHGGVRTGYGHEQVIRVSTGQKVSKGQHIADVGTEGDSDGCHLHFDVRAASGGPFSEQRDPKPVLLDHDVTYWADQ